MRRDHFTEAERAKSALWSLDAGCSADEHFRIAAGFAAAGGDFAEFNVWSATAHNYGSESACRSTWKSASQPGPITAATLYSMARAAGWTDNGETPPRPAQSRQKRSQQLEASKPPTHDPRALWDACEPATADHPYIIKKLGLPDGLRVYHGPLTIAGTACNGALVQPCRTLAGDLVSLQLIIQSGQKLFLPGCKLPHDGCLIVGGPLKAEGQIFIAEGVGQAWSVHQASRAPAVVCFGVGRMAGVSRALRERYPAARIVIVADTGKETQCASIAKAIGNAAWAEMPAGSSSNYDINDVHLGEGLAAVHDLLARAKAPAQRWKLHDADQFADQPPLEWLVKGLIPRRGVVAFYGASGCGKSFLVLDLFGAIVGEREWFGLRTVRVPALYLCLEGAAGFGKRLAAYRIEVGSLAGMKVVAEPFRLNDRQDEADIIDLIRNTGLTRGLVCIDTLAQATPGMDENSGEGMTLAIAACQRIQQATDSLVLLVHHVGKDSTKGLRGHSSLIGALDASIEVSGGIDGAPRQWEARKVKDDATGEPYHFALRRVVLGIDEDGDEVTSCVIEQAEVAANSVRKARLPSGGNMKIAWDRMGELLKSPAVVFGKASAPPGRPCVDLEAATGDIAARLTCDPKRRRERAEQAITALVARGVLAHQEGWLWLK